MSSHILRCSIFARCKNLPLGIDLPFRVKLASQILGLFFVDSTKLFLLTVGVLYFEAKEMKFSLIVFFLFPHYDSNFLHRSLACCTLKQKKKRIFPDSAISHSSI